MTRGLAAVVLLWAGAALANPEMTVDLPGGATMEFVWIEPGAFLMGAADNDALANDYTERPQHRVTITQGFWLGKYEVTQGQWTSVMGTQPWSGRSYVTPDPDRPAVYLDLADLRNLVRALHQAAALSEAGADSLYRLPTEAEWEYACRAGTTTRWWFGDDAAQWWDYEWNADPADPERFDWREGAAPVGLKRPNPWGLYDMDGNVSEWVDDAFRPYTSEDQVDPHVVPWSNYQGLYRGGSFPNPARFSGSLVRIQTMRDDSRYEFLGGRLVRLAIPVSAVTPHSWGQAKTEGR